MDKSEMEPAFVTWYEATWLGYGARVQGKEATITHAYRAWEQALSQAARELDEARGHAEDDGQRERRAAMEDARNLVLFLRGPERFASKSDDHTDRPRGEDTPTFDVPAAYASLQKEHGELEEVVLAVDAAFNPAGLEVDMPKALGGQTLLDALCALSTHRDTDPHPLLAPWEVWSAKLESRTVRFRVPKDMETLPKRVTVKGHEWPVWYWELLYEQARPEDAALPRIM